MEDKVTFKTTQRNIHYDKQTNKQTNKLRCIHSVGVMVFLNKCNGRESTCGGETAIIALDPHNLVFRSKARSQSECERDRGTRWPLA